MEIMRAKYAKWLNEIDIYPITESNWSVFQIQHREPIDMIDKMQRENNIVEGIGEKSGIYIYKNDKGEVLYIGAGDSMASKIISHYREIFQTVTKEGEVQKYHRFFQAYRGELTVFYMEIEDDGSIEILEKMLIYIFCPKLNEWITEENC